MIVCFLFFCTNAVNVKPTVESEEAANSGLVYVSGTRLMQNFLGDGANNLNVDMFAINSCA